jgi:hypothetical protein
MSTVNIPKLGYDDTILGVLPLQKTPLSLRSYSDSITGSPDLITPELIIPELLDPATIGEFIAGSEIAPV